MGNAATTRYLTNAEATEVLGSEKWAALKYRLERLTGKQMDFKVFFDVIQRRFERIVSIPYVCVITFLFAFSFKFPELF